MPEFVQRDWQVTLLHAYQLCMVRAQAELVVVFQQDERTTVQQEESRLAKHTFLCSCGMAKATALSGTWSGQAKDQSCRFARIALPCDGSSPMLLRCCRLVMS